MSLKDIKVRQITDDDMLEVTSWYVDRRWPQPPSPAALPETGFVSELNGQLLAVVWLYITNSRLAILDWVATSPKAGTKGIISLKKIIDFIELTAGKDISIYVHFTHNDKLAKHFFNKCGFQDSEKVNSCMKVVKHKKEVAAYG